MQRSRRFSPGRIIVALILAGISIITYFASSEFNPVIEEMQQYWQQKRTWL